MIKMPKGLPYEEGYFEDFTDYEDYALDFEKAMEGESDTYGRMKAIAEYASDNEIELGIAQKALMDNFGVKPHEAFEILFSFVDAEKTTSKYEGYIEARPEEESSTLPKLDHWLSDGEAYDEVDFEEKIEESIHDKCIMKALLLMGGPGSGKSAVCSAVFGAIPKGEGKVSLFPYTVVNSDTIFEWLLKKKHISTDLIDPAMLKEPEYYGLSPEEVELGNAQQGERKIAKGKHGKRIGYVLNGMHPLIIDGTCARRDKTVALINALREIGYDVSILYVYTALEIAQERNRTRARSLAPTMVEKMWTDVKSNEDTYRQVLGKNFHKVDWGVNYFKLNAEEKSKKWAELNWVRRAVFESPLENPIGIKVIEELKKNGGSYLADASDEKVDKAVQTVIAINS